MPSTSARALGSLVGLGLAACLCSGTAGLARAEEPSPPRLEVGGFVGGHFFSESNAIGRDVNSPPGNAPDHTAMIGIDAGWAFNPWVTLEGELGLVPTTARVAKGQVVGLVYRGHLLFHFLTERVRPFVLAGFGGMTIVPEYASKLQKDTTGVFHTGVGVKIGLTDRIGLRLDGRLLLVPDANGSLWTEDWEVLLGMYARFGGHVAPTAPRDSDGDGVPDGEDRCPDQAGPRDNAGCPDKDSDGDGVIDRLDKCPAAAGPRENAGCPDVDSDGDGIPDRLDRCPAERGPRANGGCPDVDSDGDGIPDRLDKCPTEPETRNGYQDEDGCPDEVPQDLAKFTGTIAGVTFQPNTNILLPASKTLLDQAAQVLAAYPDIRVEVSGHTDNVGTPDVNQKLSEVRAEAVKEYLVQKGIAAERLVAAGYGPTRPIADNTTKAGRAKNRRVEFKLLPPLPKKHHARPKAPAQPQPAQAPAPTQAPTAPTEPTQASPEAQPGK